LCKISDGDCNSHVFHHGQWLTRKRSNYRCIGSYADQRLPVFSHGQPYLLRNNRRADSMHTDGHDDPCSSSAPTAVTSRPTRVPAAQAIQIEWPAQRGSPTPTGHSRHRPRPRSHSESMHNGQRNIRRKCVCACVACAVVEECHPYAQLRRRPATRMIAVCGNSTRFCIA
jgi:hypothetical protein